MVFLRLIALLFWVAFSWSMGQTPPSGLNGFGIAVSVSFFVAAPLLYLLPTFEAWLREHPKLLAVGLLNVLLGWTVVGWVGSLVWAVAGGRPESPAAVEEDSKTCPMCAERVKAAAIKCKHCGADLSSSPA